MPTHDLFADEPIPVAEVVAELERELAMRRKVYPRLVAGGSLTAVVAGRRISLMAEAVRLLRNGS